MADLITAQGNACFYCGRRFNVHNKPTRDHLWPRCAGQSLAANKVFACVKCNRKKGARLPTRSELSRARRLYQSIGQRLREIGDATPPAAPREE